MTESGENNPFRKKKKLPWELEIPNESPAIWSRELEEFKRKARNQVHFMAPHVPDRIKDRVLATMDLIDVERMRDAVTDNRHDVYWRKTPKEQFKAWMEINFFLRELGDIKDDVFSDPSLGDGEKMMFSQLINELRIFLLK